MPRSGGKVKCESGFTLFDEAFVDHCQPAEGLLESRRLPHAARWLAEIEPLRQILAGTRAILYSDARADAGLARAVTAAALGLVFRLVVGAIVVRWYDRKGLNRMDPELLAYVSGSVQQHRSRNASARQDSEHVAAASRTLRIPASKPGRALKPELLHDDGPVWPLVDANLW